MSHSMQHAVSSDYIAALSVQRVLRRAVHVALCPPDGSSSVVLLYNPVVDNRLDCSVYVVDKMTLKFYVLLTWSFLHTESFASLRINNTAFIIRYTYLDSDLPRVIRAVQTAVAAAKAEVAKEEAVKVEARETKRKRPVE